MQPKHLQGGFREHVRRFNFQSQEFHYLAIPAQVLRKLAGEHATVAAVHLLRDVLQYIDIAMMAYFVESKGVHIIKLVNTFMSVVSHSSMFSGDPFFTLCSSLRYFLSALRHLHTSDH